MESNESPLIVCPSLSGACRYDECKRLGDGHTKLQKGRIPRGRWLAVEEQSEHDIGGMLLQRCAQLRYADKIEHGWHALEATCG
eukprot:7182908-Prymnesium_polylepis.2